MNFLLSTSTVPQFTQSPRTRAVDLQTRRATPLSVAMAGRGSILWSNPSGHRSHLPHATKVS